MGNANQDHHDLAFKSWLEAVRGREATTQPVMVPPVEIGVEYAEAVAVETPVWLPGDRSL